MRCRTLGLRPRNRSCRTDRTPVPSHSGCVASPSNCPSTYNSHVAPIASEHLILLGVIHGQTLRPGNRDENRTHVIHPAPGYGEADPVGGHPLEVRHLVKERAVRVIIDLAESRLDRRLERAGSNRVMAGCGLSSLIASMTSAGSAPSLPLAHLHTRRSKAMIAPPRLMSRANSDYQLYKRYPSMCGPHVKKRPWSIRGIYMRGLIGWPSVECAGLPTEVGKTGRARRPSRA